MILKLLISVFILGITVPTLTQNSVASNDDFNKYDEQLCEIPSFVRGVGNPRISLNGKWEFSGKKLNLENDEQFRLTKWQSIKVPGEPAMQGFPIEHDEWYAYRKSITIPTDYIGKRLMLRFNGVYSHAKVWINDEYLREHWGGFTSWECELTKFVEEGTPINLVIAFEDPMDDISFASGYAKHCIGGILRDVELIALPQNYICKLEVTADLDNDYKDGILGLDFRVNENNKDFKINVTLKDNDGKVLIQKEALLAKDNTELSFEEKVEEPLKWSAEHPNLYTLEIELETKGKSVERVVRRIGFRKLEVKGNKMLVNGSPVKLRGACRHDIHPLLGRTTTPHYDSLDVMLAKEANLNYIRTSHYPPTEKLLEYCDEYGIYVEEESAVCFVKTHKGAPYTNFDDSKDDVKYKDRYLGQLAEMVERDRNHACVVIWSLGNECTYGENFALSYDYLISRDNLRPIKFSYPATTNGHKIYDIGSFHYVDYKGYVNNKGMGTENFSADGIPALHDEWAHVACYNRYTLEEDPGVRDFWGQSMEMLWSGCFASDGGLGGAIWGMIDETFMLSDKVAGYGQWGFIDTWRRKKPEFWHTKKAYSPVKIRKVNFDSSLKGEELKIPVENRFDHTNLKEVQIKCNGERIESPHVKPHGNGIISIPHNFTRDEIKVNFYLGNRLVDAYVISFGKPVSVGTIYEINTALNVTKNENEVVVEGDNFKYSFNKNTGLIDYGIINDEAVITGGPYLNVVTPEWAKGVNQGEGKKLIPLKHEWNLASFSYEQKGAHFKAAISGTMDDLSVTYSVTIDASGILQLDYTISNMPKVAHEAGVTFQLNNQMDKIEWHREAQWSVYPLEHIGRTRGRAYRDADFSTELYREKPLKSWEQDGKDFFLFQKSGINPKTGMATNDFRTARLNLYSYKVINTKSNNWLELIDKGEITARSMVDKQGVTILNVLNHITYSDLAWGNYMITSEVPSEFYGSVKIRLSSSK